MHVVSNPGEVALAVNKKSNVVGGASSERTQLENDISHRELAEFDRKAWRTLVQGSYEQI